MGKNEEMGNSSVEVFYVVGLASKYKQTSLGLMKMSWADGMVGVCPVFDTQESAEKYANGLATVYAFRTVPTETVRVGCDDNQRTGNPGQSAKTLSRTEKRPPDKTKRRKT
jgi:hypothetical protein